MQLAGLIDFTISIESISASEISNRFIALERDYDKIKYRLTAINPILKEESRKTTRIIVDKLLQLGWAIE